MSRNRAIQELLDLEGRQDLWHREVLGFPVWGLERLRRYREELLGQEAGGGSSQGKGLARVFKELSRWNTALWDGRGDTQGRDLWVLSSSNYRKPDRAGRLRCPFSLDLEEQLVERLLFLELNPASLPRSSDPGHGFVDDVQIPSLALARAASRLLALLPVAQGLEDFGPSPRSRLLEWALYARIMLASARRRIQRQRPKAAFVVDAYGHFIPYQVALREAGIPIIELQHGLVHGSHPGYVFGEPPQPAPSHWPDHMVVFGRRFGAILEEGAPYWRGRWSVGGHPWLKTQVQVSAPKDGGIVLFAQYDPAVRRRILNLSQELRRRLPQQRSITIKPHPREFDAESFYAEASAHGVTVAGPGEDSYALLARCSMAVSAFSTISIEALAFPCRSVLLESEHWSDVLADFVERGVLSTAKDAADVLRLLESEGPEEEHDGEAQAWFGLGEPPLDYGALLAKVESEIRA